MVSNDFIASEDMFLTKVGNIFITKEQIDILKKYDIDINKYKNINELIFDIETLLNNYHGDFQDLEWVSTMLSDYNYYNNTNK